MPRMPRSRNAAVIEASITLNLAHPSGGRDDEEACIICRHMFCSQETCARTATTLHCCTQALCCACAIKVAKRCTCNDDCEEVIAICPFCREIARLSALEVFLGSRPACRACIGPPRQATPVPSSRETQATPTPPQTETASDTIEEGDETIQEGDEEGGEA